MSRGSLAGRPAEEKNTRKTNDITNKKEAGVASQPAEAKSKRKTKESSTVRRERERERVPRGSFGREFKK